MTAQAMADLAAAAMDRRRGPSTAETAALAAAAMDAMTANDGSSCSSGHGCRKACGCCRDGPSNLPSGERGTRNTADRQKRQRHWQQRPWMRKLPRRQLTRRQRAMPLRKLRRWQLMGAVGQRPSRFADAMQADKQAMDETAKTGSSRCKRPGCETALEGQAAMRKLPDRQLMKRPGCGNCPWSSGHGCEDGS